MKYLAHLFFILCIVGCSHGQSHNALLTEAEQMVFTQPDSVVRMLSPLWADSTMTEADRALFGLLYTEAIHRSDLSMMADSLIMHSVDYYERVGDRRRLARALLHHAIILYKQMQTHEAVLAMKRAEQMAEREADPAFNWYLYSVLGDVNDNVGNYPQTLRYYRQAYAAARQCDNEEWMVRTLNNIAMTFDLLGETDSLHYYTQMASQLAQNTAGEVYATFLENLARCHMAEGRQQEAKNCLLKAQALFHTDRSAKLLSDIYLDEGDTIAAREQWYRLINSMSPEVSIESYRKLISYLNRRGLTEEVADYSQRLNEVYRRLYEHNDAAGIIELQAQYDKQLKERRQYRRTIALLAAILALVAVAVGIVVYNRRRIDVLNNRFMRSQEQYNMTREELTQMRRQKEREQRQNSRQIKEVVSRLHVYANKGKAAPADDIDTLAQLSYAQSPALQELLSVLNAREQAVCLLTRQNFLPTEIAVLTISTPQSITNMRVRLLKKLFSQTGGAKDFDNLIKGVAEST